MDFLGLELSQMTYPSACVYMGQKSFLTYQSWLSRLGTFVGGSAFCWIWIGLTEQATWNIFTLG